MKPKNDRLNARILTALNEALLRAEGRDNDMLESIRQFHLSHTVLTKSQIRAIFTIHGKLTGGTMPKQPVPMLEVKNAADIEDKMTDLFREAVALRDQSQDHLSHLLELKQAVQILRMKETLPLQMKGTEK